MLYNYFDVFWCNSLPYILFVITNIWCDEWLKQPCTKIKISSKNNTNINSNLKIYSRNKNYEKAKRWNQKSRCIFLLQSSCNKKSRGYQLKQIPIIHLMNDFYRNNSSKNISDTTDIHELAWHRKLKIVSSMLFFIINIIIQCKLIWKNGRDCKNVLSSRIG